MTNPNVIWTVQKDESYVGTFVSSYHRTRLGAEKECMRRWEEDGSTDRYYVWEIELEE